MSSNLNLNLISKVPDQEVDTNLMLAVRDEIDFPFLSIGKPKFIFWGSDDGDEWVVLGRSQSILELIKMEAEDPQPYSHTTITGDVYWRKPTTEE